MDDGRKEKHVEERNKGLYQEPNVDKYCIVPDHTSVSMNVITRLGCSLTLHVRRSDARVPLLLGEYLRSLESATECFL
jgi:hypothetical protein